MARVYSSGDISLVLTWHESQNYLTQTTRMIVTLKCKRDCSHLLSGAYVLFPGNNHWRSVKEYVDRKTSVILELEPLAGAGIDTFQSSFTLTLYDGREQKMESTIFSLPINRFTRHFFEDGGVADTNILLFGLASSTKSSFINSSFRILSAGKECDMALSGGSQVRVSTEFRSYRLADLSDRNNVRTTRYRLWDIWGVEKNNYRDTLFEQILEGRVQSGLKMEEGTGRLNQLQFAPVNGNWVQNCIIFFIPVTELSNTGQGSMAQHTRAFIERATEKGIASIIVISKMDTVLDNWTPDMDMSNIMSNPTVNQYITTATNIFRVQESRVLPLITHYVDTSQTVQIDRLVYRVLDTACRVARAGSYSSKTSTKNSIDQALADIINS